MSSPQIHRSKNRENSFSSKKIFARLFLLSFLIICFVENATTISAATGINDQISFQGKVVNTDGTNVANGSYDFVFSIYTVSSGGTAVWTETWNSGTSQVTVTDGIFQVSLGTHTDLPGSIDFNTDNIYLGIEFNGDGEMSPRVHFTAAPYAFNAMKVAGLTVTDTTGTLTIPNGETISFGGSFTTSASNDVILSTSGATNVTLPTTGTLATLAGSEILTNKTIGSTGLTFSGATTDITTASGENLTLEGNGAGVIQFNDASTAAGTMTFSGPSTDITTATDQDLTLLANGAGIINLNDSVTSGALTISGATTDITTGSGESLVLVANGAGVIDLQDATTADSLTLDSGGLTLQNSETIGNGTDDIIAFTGTSGADNTDLFLDLDGTSPVLYSNTDNRVSVEDYLNVQVSGVTGAATGDIWYDSAANKFKVNESGTTKILCNTTDLGCGSGGASDLQTTYGTDADGGNATISLTTADDSLVFTNPSSSGTDSAFVLQVSQQHTTDAIAILDLIQSSNAANGVNLTANAIDGETGLAITTNGLTSGSALSITSSSTAFTGSLAGITFSGSNAANTGNVFAVSNTGALNTNTSFLVQHDATGTNNLAVRVNDEASDTTPFVIDGAGNVGIGTATPSRVLDIFQASSVPQLRLSKDLTNYSEFTVDSVGDLQLAATGTDIRALSENLWVCDNDACPALTLTGDGNIFVENVLKFGNGVYLKNDSATELGVYDNDDQVMLIFDEQ